MVKKVTDILPKEKKDKKASAFLSNIIKEEKGLKKITHKKLIFAIFAVFILFVFVFIFSFSFAKIRIKIWPSIETVTHNVDVNLIKNAQSVDFEKNILPSNIIETEEVFSDEFSSTGKLKKETKSQGTVRIFNNFTKDQILVADTRLQAPLDKFVSPLEKNEKPWFRTVEKVIVPANGHVDVKVIADSPGEKYNIGPTTFSIPGLLGTPQYSLIYGKSSEAMKGGTIKEVSQVTKNDIEKAEYELTERVKNEILKVLSKKIPQGFELIPETLSLEYLEKKPLCKIEEEKERFTYQIKARASVIAVKKVELEDFSKNYILKKIPNGKEIEEGSLKINWKKKSIDQNLEKAIISLEITAGFYSKLDKEKIKDELKGLSVSEAKEFLERKLEFKKVTIGLFPFWITKIPRQSEKLEIFYPVID